MNEKDALLLHLAQATRCIENAIESAKRLDPQPHGVETALAAIAASLSEAEWLVEKAA